MMPHEDLMRMLTFVAAAVVIAAIVVLTVF